MNKLHLLIFCFIICISCNEEWEDVYSKPSQSSIKEFEDNFVNNLTLKTKSLISNDIVVIGYQTIKIPYSERTEMLESLKDLKLVPPSDSIPMVDFYVAPDGSFVRIYFEVIDPILEEEETVFMPDNNGRVKLNNNTSMADLNFIGQKRTADRRGTGSNIVTGDKILFSKYVPKTSVYSNKNALIYDFGERFVGQCNDKIRMSTLLSTKTESGPGGRISCRDNHGKICSFAYSYVTGRCSHCYSADRCMDFNGEGSDCINYGDGMWRRTRNFIGSDCYWLITHCLNESF